MIGLLCIFACYGCAFALAHISAGIDQKRREQEQNKRSRWDCFD